MFSLARITSGDKSRNETCRIVLPGATSVSSEMYGLGEVVAKLSNGELRSAARKSLAISTSMSLNVWRQLLLKVWARVSSRSNNTRRRISGQPANKNRAISKLINPQPNSETESDFGVFCKD